MVNNIIRENLCNLWWKKPNAARSIPTPFRINYQLSIKSKDYGTKQVTLGKNPQHRNHRVNRHRHHLRGDLLHGRVKIEEKAGTTLSAFPMKIPYWKSATKPSPRPSFHSHREGRTTHISKKNPKKVLVIQKKGLPLHPQTRKQLSNAEMRK